VKPHKEEEIVWTAIRVLCEEISPETVLGWETLSHRKLGDEAERYGLRLGIRNGKAVSTLLDRMKAMAERRRARIWSRVYSSDGERQADTVETADYRLMNVFALRDLLSHHYDTCLFCSKS
jgi:hypothetical protein